MKYLKNFNEAEVWAGSNWAYHNPLVVKGFDKVEGPSFTIWHWKCNECNTEFSTDFPDQKNCKLCKSFDIKPIIPEKI